MNRQKKMEMMKLQWIKENKTVVELIDEVVDISKATEYNDELWCRIYKIFEEAPQFQRY